jgi:hypothetical protein
MAWEIARLAYTPDMIYRATEFARRRYPKSSGYALRWRVSLALDGRAPQPYVMADAEEVLASPPALFARPRFVLPMQDGSLPTFSQLAAGHAGQSPDT